MCKSTSVEVGHPQTYAPTVTSGTDASECQEVFGIPSVMSCDVCRSAAAIMSSLLAGARTVHVRLTLTAAVGITFPVS
jgi:hypothetical protein